jgi:dihydrolipoamide dehydrogenase
VSGVEFDVVVIGAGPGGYPAAIRAAQHGLRVACVEREELGGVCLNVGCIPSKALLKTAELAHKARHAADWGLRIGAVEVDYPAVIARSRSVADRFVKGVRGLFKKYGVHHIAGEAKLLAPGRVAVGETVLVARHVVIATGARARSFPGIELDGTRVVTYREAIRSTVAPRSAIVLGAGAIGIEFAYFWNAMGVDVTVVEAMPEILPAEDADCGAVVRRSMKKSGVAFHVGRRAATAAADGDGARVVLDDGTELRADVVLCALGIAPNSEGLDAIGLRLERGFVAIDDRCATNLPGVWAVGDVTIRGGLAHTATAQAHVVADAIAGKPVHAVAYDAIPGATYCQPQVASVGAREADLAARGVKFTVGRFPFSANARAVGSGGGDGFVKVLLGEPHGELLGASLVGLDVTDLVAELGLMKTGELTADELLHTVHAHPTLSEVVYEAVAVARGGSVHV